MKADPAVEILRCSFCEKPQHKVSALIDSPLNGHPAAYICDECVGLCTPFWNETRDEAVGQTQATKQEAPSIA